MFGEPVTKSWAVLPFFKDSTMGSNRVIVNIKNSKEKSVEILPASSIKNLSEKNLWILIFLNLPENFSELRFFFLIGLCLGFNPDTIGGVNPKNNSYLPNSLKVFGLLRHYGKVF
jgi:hypothetical protein